MDVTGLGLGEHQRRCGATELLAGPAHGGEGHGCGGGELDVVVPGDREVLRDPQAGADRVLEQAEGEQVVGTERGGGSAALGEPGDACPRFAASGSDELGGLDDDEVVGRQAGVGPALLRPLEAVADLADAEGRSSRRSDR